MRRAPVVLALTFALAVPGCSSHHEVTRPVSRSTTPVPSSPEGAVRLLEWGWGHRNAPALAGLFTSDFQFVFLARDSAGLPVRDPPLGRGAMLCATNQLFLGGGSQPRATSIALTFDPTLNPQPDGRPGKDPKWHKEILTSLDLAIEVEGGKEYRVSGYARFFVVRGDSALIPQELEDRGFGPDSLRWYVERWNDETLGDAARLRAAPAAPLPALTTTWGTILALYRCP